jgi:outer membrane protein insertion porin family
LLPWVAEAQQYYGTRLDSLAVSDPAAEAQIPDLPLKVGDLITEANVRASIQALYETGRYSYIEVDATGGTTGTRLEFRVRRHYFFSTFRLVPESLLPRPISSYTRLPVGEKFSRAVVDRIAGDVAELLRSEGYFDTQITPQFEFEDATRLATVMLNARSGDRATIGMVRITGGEQTFSQEELLDALDVETGEDFSAADLDQGITEVRTLFTDLGFLNTRVEVQRNYDSATKMVHLDVRIEPGTFTLVEARGYDISRNRLRELVPTFEEGTVDSDLVEEGRVAIERYLEQEGYFEAVVRSEIIEAPLDNAAQIVYAIEPGDRHRINSVKIVGNDYFSVDEIKARMQIRSQGLLSRGRFSADTLEQDVRAIRLMYLNAGLQGTEVAGRFSEENQAIDVVIDIDEGEQLSIDAITFTGNNDIPDDELRKALTVTEGAVYTPPVVEEGRNALTSYYYSKGYPDVRIEPALESAEANHGVKVTYRITEGQQYRIGEILVEGNEVTQDKIIFRHSPIYPNTPYNPEDVLEAQQRLYATGLFTRVDVVTLDENLPGVRNLLIQVEEARRVLLSYGLGFQEYEGVRGTVELSYNNLWGLDRSISFRLRGSRREQRFQSTYREPQLFNWSLDGFASLFIERTERPSFDFSRVDFSIQTLKRFSLQRNLLLTASYQTVNLRDVRDNRQAIKIPEETGVIQIGRVGASFIVERRDDPINTTTGFFNTTTFQIATSALGSEVNFTSLFHQSNFYTPVRFGVLATSGRFGWNQPYGGTERIPISERYFAGGSTTLRGYDLDEAGPPTGGNALLIGNIEYRVPLTRFPVRGFGIAGFYDTGNVFEEISNVRLSGFTHTAGFGLRYETPLGPVRLDIGFNLKPQLLPTGVREERTQVFFTLGHAF